MLLEGFKKQITDAAAAIRQAARARPVVLVFGLGSYGDVIQITPLLQALKRKFPEASVLLVHHDLLGAKLLESAPYLAKYIRLASGYHHLLRHQLADEDYDLIVECRYVIKYTRSLKSRLSEFGNQFIRAAEEKQKPWLKYVQNFPLDNDQLWRAAKEQNFSMFGLMEHTAGFEGEDFEAGRIDLPLDRPAPKELGLPARYVVVSNSAEWLSLQGTLWTKCLPHAKMKDVLRRLRAARIPTVLLGTTNDPGDYAVDHDLRGKTNLLEAAEVLRHARALLGPEGGLVNLARALEIPSVVFFGSTPMEFFQMKANINLKPTFCGGCWWSTESYLRQCPLLEAIPPCTNSIDAGLIVDAVKSLFDATP